MMSNGSRMASRINPAAERLVTGGQVHHYLPESNRGAHGPVDHAGVYLWNASQSPCGRTVMSRTLGHLQVLIALREVGIPCQWLVGSLLIISATLCWSSKTFLMKSGACRYFDHVHGISGNSSKLRLPYSGTCTNYP